MALRGAPRLLPRVKFFSSGVVCHKLKRNFCGSSSHSPGVQNYGRNCSSQEAPGSVRNPLESQSQTRSRETQGDADTQSPQCEKCASRSAFWVLGSGFWGRVVVGMLGNGNCELEWQKRSVACLPRRQHLAPPKKEH